MPPEQHDNHPDHDFSKDAWNVRVGPLEGGRHAGTKVSVVGVAGLCSRPGRCTHGGSDPSDHGPVILMSTRAMHNSRTVGTTPDERAPTPPATESSGWRAARVLSAIVAVLIVAASAARLWIAGLYQDPQPVAEMFRGYDLVTLVLVAPLLAVTLLPGMQARPWARLVWVGTLAYAVYNYALYVFGMQFNAAFLLHVGVFTTALYALVLALSQLDVGGLARRFVARTPVLVVAVILLVLAVSLGTMWVAASLRFAVTGELPEEASQLVVPINITRLGYALDLSLLIPAYVLAAVLLWRRRGWGYVLAAMLLVSGTVHQLGYMTALVFQAAPDIPGATAFDPIEPFITLAYVTAAVLLLVNVRLPKIRISRPGPRLSAAICACASARLTMCVLCHGAVWSGVRRSDTTTLSIALLRREISRTTGRASGSSATGGQ